ncbi:hypothetical protein L249_1054, partial [Ophiocordyceps polyrhachis-furcata BCC 54312]
TWPEGLGGLHNAGSATADPRPPYVIEAIRYSGCTRPEGLGGSRDAGSATADPRPPYVTEAIRGGYGYGTATPYSGYGRTGRTGPFLPSL